MSEHDHQAIPFIRELCTHLSEDELVEAEERVWLYVEIAEHIYERAIRERRPRPGLDSHATRFDNEPIDK